MSTYGTKYNKPIGVGSRGLGGAGTNLGIAALAGDTELTTVFDDFDSTIKGTDTFGGAAIFEDSGWVLTDSITNAPTNDEIAMNDPSNVDLWAPSCLYIYGGDTDDAGGNMQLDLVNGAVGTLVGTADFPHIIIPETDIGAAALDNHVFVFACRVGFRADLTTTGAGDWDSKAFIGWAEAGDTGILTVGDGTIVQPETGPLVGFHILENGSVRGISQRTVNTAYAAGTNYVELYPAGGVDGTVARGAVAAGDTMWFDLALRMVVTDWNVAGANGYTQFFSRRVPKVLGAGVAREEVVELQKHGNWNKHQTTLLNQCPSNDVALVPTIEFVNGPTADVDGLIMLDWWTFGVSRFSRR